MHSRVGDAGYLASIACASAPIRRAASRCCGTVRLSRIRRSIGPLDGPRAPARLDPDPVGQRPAVVGWIPPVGQLSVEPAPTPAPGRHRSPIEEADEPVDVGGPATGGGSVRTVVGGWVPDGGHVRRWRPPGGDHGGGTSGQSDTGASAEDSGDDGFSDTGDVEGVSGDPDEIDDGEERSGDPDEIDDDDLTVEPNRRRPGRIRG